MGLFKRIYEEADFFTLDALSLLVSILCDVASFTPLHAIFLPNVATGYAWEDLHPGYRLLKALECINQQMTVAGQSILVSNPNLSISLPGGISVIINQQTSSSGGTSGSITVNALHVAGPSIDIVVASANSDITCS